MGLMKSFMKVLSQLHKVCFKGFCNWIRALREFLTAEGVRGEVQKAPLPPWFLVGNGGMGYWHYYRGPLGTIIGIHSPFSY